MPSSPSLSAAPDLDRWIAITADGQVRVRSGKIDIGQRISTAVALIVAEELDVDPARVVVEERRTGVSPDEGMTSGSNSIQHSGTALRQASATARRFLLDKAAAALDAPAASLVVEDGLVRAPESNRTISYWELQGDAAFGITVDAEAPAKAPGDYRVLGQPAEARGLGDAVAGRHGFVHDMVLPEMLHGRVVRPPHYHARLTAIEPAVLAKLESAGVTVARDGSFLAVAGPDEYATIKAAETLAAAATWDLAGGLPIADLHDSLLGNPRESRHVVEGTPAEGPVPDKAPPPPDASTTITATYAKPYVMHGAIGPSAAMALAKEDGITLWTHSQGIYPLRQSMTEALGIPLESLTVIHAQGAGCYGHNGADDAAFDAVLLARAVPGRPVLLKWTRADEHAWEPYTSAMAVALEASLDADGAVIAWDGQAFSDTHVQRPRPGPNKVGASRLLASRFRADPIPPRAPQPMMVRHAGLHRNLDPYYAFPRRRIVKNLVRGLPLRTSAMRTLGGFGNVFAIESFMDELARASGQDPLTFRLRHLEDPRARDVLQAAADAIGWPGSDGDGTGTGIAFARYTNAQAYAAVAVTLSVDDAAAVSVRRAVIAADAGQVIDRDGLALQMEGGFLQAMSWALYEEVTWDRDGVTSRDWDSYPILTFDAVPEVEVALIDRPGDPPLGAGEASSGPTGAALANAIFAATGVRPRRMPFTPANLRAAAQGD